MFGNKQQTAGTSYVASEVCKDTPASKATPTDARLQVIQAPVQFSPTSNRADTILSNGE